LERDALVGLDVADYLAGVLLREQALGHDGVEINIKAEGGDHD
jgi:hypothetical protein